MTLTITAEPAKGYIPLTVIFSHTSSLTPSSYAWDFGDGNISEEAAPAHTYETPGTYTVSLKITDAYSVSETASATITVEEPTAPAVSISADITKAYAPQTIRFECEVSGGIPDDYRYAWDFGDGNISEEAEPAHTYETAGTYIAKLTVSNNGGHTKTAAEITVILEEPTAPAVSISADITEAYAPQTIRFECEVSGGIPDDYRYAWDFGDGNISDEPNPEYRYSAAGTYTAKLTVSTNGGMIRTESQPLTIIIIEATYPNIILKTEQTGQFTIKISNLTEHPDIQPSAISWDFGDGTETTATTPEAMKTQAHTYAQAGIYNVIVTIQYANGYFHTATIRAVLYLLNSITSGIVLNGSNKRRTQWR